MISSISSLTAEVTYLSGGQLDSARNITLNGIVQFDTLLEAYEALTPHSAGLYTEIEEAVTRIAAEQWRADHIEAIDHRTWDRTR